MIKDVLCRKTTSDELFSNNIKIKNN